jgi:hypothetical protein
MAYSRRLASPPAPLLPAGPLPAITFPTTPLKVKVEVALAADVTDLPATWGWADATAITYHRDPITIERGRQDQASLADTAGLTMTGDNRDGHWSTRNPASPWHGLLRKGSPVRVTVEGFPRYTGFFTVLPPRWDASGLDRYAPLEAKGWLYLLGRGAAPERSALRRTTLKALPVQYWPMEDDDNVRTFSVAVGSGQLSASGIMYVGANAPLGSLSLPDFSGGERVDFTGQPGTEASWRLDFWVLIPTALASPVTVASWYTTGTLSQIDLTHDTTTAGLSLGYIGSAGSGFFSSSVEIDDGEWHHIRVQTTPLGSQIFAHLFIDGVSAGSSPALSDTAGYVSHGALNPARVTAFSSFGHLAIFAPYDTPGTADVTDAGLNAYDGELAHVRFLRLAAEEGITARSQAPASVVMGPQPVAKLLDLLRECEAASQGFMYEGTAFDLVLQVPQERENAPPLLELNYGTRGHVAPPLEPTDDDQNAINDIEVQSSAGASARQVEEDPLQELSIPNIGRRDDSQTLNVAVEHVEDLAGWRLRLGTWPGYRYPSIHLNLFAEAGVAAQESREPWLIGAICTADLGFRLKIVDPPADITDTVDVIVEGYSEVLQLYGWSVVANASPYGPYDVRRLAGDSGDFDGVGWWSPDTFTLAADVDTTATSWQVNVEPVLSTDADNYPCPVLIGGEEVTITAVSGAAAPQTATVTRSVNGVVKAHTAGAAVELKHPLVLTFGAS